MSPDRIGALLLFLWLPFTATASSSRLVESPPATPDAPVRQPSSRRADASVSSGPAPVVAPSPVRQEEATPLSVPASGVSSSSALSPSVSSALSPGSGERVFPVPPPKPGALVSAPIDLWRSGNALLLTADELRTAMDREEVRTRSHLEEYAKALLQTDMRVSHIEIGESGVRVQYRHPAKLLGFLPVNYALETAVDARGQVHMEKPWWLWSAADEARRLEKTLQGQIIEERLILANLLGIEDAEERRQALMQMLADILRLTHGVHQALVQAMHG